MGINIFSEGIHKLYVPSIFYNMRAFVLLLFPAFTNYVQCLDLDLLYLLLNKEVSDNPECEAQKNDFLEGLRNNETWALKS